MGRVQRKVPKFEEIGDERETRSVRSEEDKETLQVQ